MELAPHLAQNGLALERIDISGRAELESRYGEAIPVLTLGDTEICRHFFDPDRFHDRLSQFGLIR